MRKRRSRRLLRHDVGHERVGGDEPAARQGERKRPEVERVARAGAPLRELAFEDDRKPPLALPLDGGLAFGQTQTTRQLAQKRMTGTIGVLLPAVERAYITRDEGDRLLAEMIEAGYWSPVASVAEALGRN
jgi:hypothetical protein